MTADPTPLPSAAGSPEHPRCSPELLEPPHTSERSEAEARIQAALKVAKEGRALGNKAETAHARGVLLDIAIGRVIRILDGGNRC
jgi:hypothetical protein